MRLSIIGSLAATAALAAGSQASGSPCDQATISWDGGAATAAWTTAANWTGDRLPNADDHVCIPAGAAGASVTHSGSTSVKSLEAHKPFTLGGALTLTSTTVTSSMEGGTIAGTLNGPGELQIGGTVNWTGGEMGGFGTTRVLTGARLNVTYQGCCSNRTIGSNYTLVNDGTLAIDGGEGLNLSTNFQIRNNGHLEWAPTNYSEIVDTSASGTVKPLITNTGTIVKTTGADKYVYVALWNKSGGVVKSDYGSLLLSGGAAGNAHSGTFAGGVTLYGTQPLSNATFTGTNNRLQGTNALGQGTTTTIASGSTTLAGYVDGPGTLLVQGTLEWTGGEMKSSATAEVAPGGRLNIRGSGCCSAWSAGSNATVVNNGTLSVSGSYGINLGENFRIQNNSTFEFAPGSYLDIYDNAPAGTTKPLITNTGTIVKTAGGDRSFHVPVWNKTGGVIRSDVGKLFLQGGSGGNPTSGTFAGNVVLYGTYPMSGATFTGTGNKVSAILNLAEGSPTTVASGSTTLANVVNGPGKLLVQGTLDWTGGEMKSSATTEVAPGGRLNMLGSGCCSEWTAGSNATVVNNGTLYFGGSYGITLGQNFRIENKATFEYAPGTYATLYENAPSGTVRPLIVNTGTIVKTVGGDKTLYAPVWNQAGGVIRSDAGTLSLQGGSAGNTASGTFAGGVAIWGTQPLANVTFTGTNNKMYGNHSLVQGTTSTIAPGSTTILQGYLDGPGRLLVRGTLDWAGGEMGSFGSTYVASEGRLNVTYQGCCSNRSIGSNYTIVNDGMMSIAGGEGLTVGDAFEIYNNGTLEWDPTHYSEIYDNSTTTKPLISNSGTFVKKGGYDKPIYVPVENDGTIKVEAGGLSLYGRFRSYSRTRSILTEGEYELKGALRVAGLNVLRNAARITLDGTAGALTDQAGTNALRNLARNAGGGRLTLRNGAALTVSTLRNAGKVTVEAGSTLTTSGYTQVRGATVVDASNSTLAVGTTAGMSITGGSLRGSGVVQGHVTNSGGAVMPGSAATPGSLSVQGSFTQTSNGTLDLDVATLGSSDTLAVTGAATLGGRLSLLTGGAYAPAVGDVFTLVTFASQTGAFASTAGLQLPGGLVYSIQLQPQSTTAVVQ